MPLVLRKGFGLKGRSCLPIAGERECPPGFQVPMSTPACSPTDLDFGGTAVSFPRDWWLGEIRFQWLSGGTTGVDLSF